MSRGRRVNIRDQVPRTGNKKYHVSISLQNLENGSAFNFAVKFFKKDLSVTLNRFTECLLYVRTHSQMHRGF